MEGSQCCLLYCFALAACYPKLWAFLMLLVVLNCRLDLLPMYARLVATLDPCAPDLAPELVQQLKGEFRFRVSIIISIYLLCIQDWR